MLIGLIQRSMALDESLAIVQHRLFAVDAKVIVTHIRERRLDVDECLPDRNLTVRVIRLLAHRRRSGKFMVRLGSIEQIGSERTSESYLP